MRTDFLLSLSIASFFAICVQSEDVVLKCDEFERLYELSAGETFCTVSGFRVSHNQNVKIQKHLRSNSTIYMKFYDSLLLYLPFKLFDAFNHLKNLDVSFTEILDVPRNSFSAANTLTFLNMSNNNITQLSTSVFVGASSLLRLDLSRNQIADINEFAFQGLRNLDMLLLSNNRIRSLSKELFTDNAYVETIILDGNQIEYIEPEVFSRLQHLRNVNLANNRLRRVHPQTFQAAYDIETLVLSSNRLTEFHLTNKSVLVQLRLEHNSLTSISIDATKTVRAEHNQLREIVMLNPTFLEDLMVANNSLTDISNITQLTNLLYLDLSYNRIGALNITTFDRLKRLRELSLRSTGLRDLTYGMLSKQTQLELLDLSYNNLTELNLKLFVPYLSKLKTLYVDGNGLTELQGITGFSFAFPHLAKLGISQNRFNCSYLHTILMPPYLSATVSLHIEPVTSAEESSHIRDITCQRTAKKSLPPAKVGAELSELEGLRLHEQRLVLCWLVMKILFLALVSVLIGVLSMRFWRGRRSNYLAGGGGGDGSIMFRSTNTVNTEH